MGREVWVIDRESKGKLQRLVEKRVVECIEVATIVAGDCEGNGELLQISFMAIEGIVTCMFKGWRKLPYKIRGLLDDAKVILLGDRNRDLDFMVTRQEEHICHDVGLCMVELEGFWNEGKTGM